MKIRTLLAVAALLATAAPMSAQTPATGRVVADTVPAPSLAGNLLGDPVRQPAFVYLPPGYDAEPGRRYATIYLLHGVLDSPSVWVKPIYQGMTIQAAMDSLIAVGEIRPMIVVMPNGRNAYGASAYMNSSVNGNWGDFISKDLVAYVDSTYRTLPQRESRAITGHSMGGFGALRLAMLHPDVFSVAWGMSPCCLCCVGQETPADHPVWRELDKFHSAKEMWKHLEDTGDIWPLIVAGAGTAFAPDPDRPPLYFDPLYRVEGDSMVPTGVAKRWAAALPLATVAHHVAGLKSLRGFGFDDGYADQFVHIPIAVHAFSDTLFALGVPHVFEMYDGDHRDRIGERLPGRVLPWLDARLVHEPDGPRSSVDGQTVTVDSWPPVKIRVDPALAPVGSVTADLYGVADARIHVFAQADDDGTVRRLLWLQVEQMRPTSHHGYDYSRLKRRVTDGPLDFVADARHGPAYSKESVRSGGDTARVLGLLEKAGLRLPDPMMRIRMLDVDGSHKRELMAIYLEGYPAEGGSADDAAWERTVAGLTERARSAMEIESR